MKKIQTYVPARNVQDWKELLQDKNKQWKEGYSAFETAHTWHRDHGFPEIVANVFLRAGQPFSNMVPLICIPEHQVPLPGEGRPSHNDIWILARHECGLASIAVEGKVDEDFDKLVGKWREAGGENRCSRLKGVLGKLGFIKSIPDVDHIRYQLLHRAASAAIEAERFHAKLALLLVHSFSKSNSHFNDYCKFVQLFGVRAEVNTVIHLGTVNGIELYATWINPFAKSEKC